LKLFTKRRVLWGLGIGVPALALIHEEKWPELRRIQIELLVAEGISRAQAEELYAPFK
jgi:hypothetical protein